MTSDKGNEVYRQVKEKAQYMEPSQLIIEWVARTAQLETSTSDLRQDFQRFQERSCRERAALREELLKATTENAKKIETYDNLLKRGKYTLAGILIAVGFVSTVIWNRLEILEFLQKVIDIFSIGKGQQ